MVTRVRLLDVPLDPPQGHEGRGLVRPQLTGLASVDTRRAKSVGEGLGPFTDDALTVLSAINMVDSEVRDNSGGAPLGRGGERRERRPRLRARGEER